MIQVARTRWSVGEDRPAPEAGAVPARAAMPPISDTRRVLMVVESCGGGVGRHVFDLTEGLIERHWEVHLVYSPGRAEPSFRRRLESITGLVHAACPMRRCPHPSDVTALRFLRRYLRDRGPFAIVHGHSSKAGALARLAAVGVGAGVVYTPHALVTMDPGLPRAKRLVYRAAERAMAPLADRIIAVSPAERRHALSLGLGADRVIAIPNGLTRSEAPPRPVVRRWLGLGDDEPVIGFVGRLVPQKAPDVLLRALALAAEAVPGCRLAMVGSGPLEDHLRDLAGRLGVADRMLWLGDREGRPLLAAFDVFALPSRYEGLPYVALEALAAGLPIVATAESGVGLVVRDGRNGRIVPRDRPDRLAAALIEYLADDDLRRRAGDFALRRAMRFTAVRMVDRTLAAYAGCRAGRTSRAGGDNDRPAVVNGRREAPRAGRVPGPPPRVASPPAFDPGDPAMDQKPRSAEMHPGPGFRIQADFARPDPALMRGFAEFDTPDISDLLNRLYAVHPEIRCLTGLHHKLCGPACTVKVFPGDNLMVHKVLDVARPGDVVVIDAGGSSLNAVLGDLISTKAQHRGIAGFVVDGYIRDLPAILELDFPVFARGTTPIGPLHRGPGEINLPVCCGGVVVNPGDLIVADGAGTVVVPQLIIAELLERLRAQQEANRSYHETVRRGTFSNAWVDRLLEEQGCPVIEPDWDGAPSSGGLARDGLELVDRVR